MPEDLTPLVNKLTARIDAKLPKNAGVTAFQLVGAILGTVMLELAKRDARADRMEQERDQANVVLSRVGEWLEGEPVTGRNEFGQGYREAMGDLRDLLDGLPVGDSPAELSSLDQGTDQPDDLDKFIEAERNRDPAFRAAYDARQGTIPEVLHDTIRVLLLNHHHELLKPAGEQDAEIAELAQTYRRLTGWDALEEIAHHEAHVRMGEAFKDASTWTEDTGLPPVSDGDLSQVSEVQP